jgi:hypothetical protein
MENDTTSENPQSPSSEVEVKTNGEQKSTDEHDDSDSPNSDSPRFQRYTFLVVK